MHTSKKAYVWAAAIVAAAGGSLHAQAAQLPGALQPGVDQPPTRQGTRGANFLEIGVGARESALAGAAAALTDGPSAWYWNPAGATSVEGFSAVASRQDMYRDLDITHNFAALSIPLFGGVVGVNFTSLNSGDIDRSTPDEPFGDRTVGSTFTWNSTAVGAGYARRLTDRLDVGAQIKLISEGLSDASTSWGAVDLGTKFRTGLYGLTLGATIQNVGPAGRMRGQLINRNVNTDRFNDQNTRVQLRTVDTELPTMFRFSVASDIYGEATSLYGTAGSKHVLRGELAVSDAIDTDVQSAIGLEYSFNQLFFLRGGKRFFNDDRSTGSAAKFGTSVGAGVRIPAGARSLVFDYAYTGAGDLQDIQVFTFSLRR
jgi:hypothetical protein